MHPSPNSKKRAHRATGAALVLIFVLAHAVHANGKIVLVGTLGAGKTFVCNQLEGGDDVCGNPSDGYKAGNRKCHNSTAHVIDTIGFGHNVKQENGDMTGTTVSVMNTLDCAEGEDVSAVVYVLRCEGANRIGTDAELEALATFMSLMGGTKLYVYFNADVNGDGTCRGNKGLQAVNEAVADYGLRFDAVLDASTLHSGSEILRAPGATVTLPPGWRDTLRNSDAKVAAELLREHQKSHCGSVELAAKAAGERLAAAVAALGAARREHRTCECDQHAKSLQECKMVQPTVQDCYSMVCEEHSDRRGHAGEGAALGAAVSVFSGFPMAPFVGAALGSLFGGTRRECTKTVRVTDDSCVAANAAALEAAKTTFDNCRVSHTQQLELCKAGRDACEKRVNAAIASSVAERDAASKAVEELHGTLSFCTDVLFKSSK